MGDFCVSLRAAAALSIMTPRNKLSRRVCWVDPAHFCQQQQNFYLSCEPDKKVRAPVRCPPFKINQFQPKGKFSQSINNYWKIRHSPASANSGLISFIIHRSFFSSTQIFINRRFQDFLWRTENNIMRRVFAGKLINGILR